MRRAGLGEYFLKDLDKKLTSLSITPALGSVRYDDVRVTFTTTFPYIIHYFIDTKNKKVVILRVLHGRRKPIY